MCLIRYLGYIYIRMLLIELGVGALLIILFGYYFKLRGEVIVY